MDEMTLRVCLILKPNLIEHIRVVDAEEEPMSVRIVMVF